MRPTACQDASLGDDDDDAARPCRGPAHLSALHQLQLTSNQPTSTPLTPHLIPVPDTRSHCSLTSSQESPGQLHSASSRQHPTLPQALLAPCLTSWEKFREKLVFPRQSQWDKCLSRDCSCCSKMWVSQRSAESTQAQEMQKKKQISLDNK